MSKHWHQRRELKHCIDCNNEFLGVSSRKRCDDCRHQQQLRKQRMRYHGELTEEQHQAIEAKAVQRRKNQDQVNAFFVALGIGRRKTEFKRADIQRATAEQAAKIINRILAGEVTYVF